jgi:hypothetical protein
MEPSARAIDQRAGTLDGWHGIDILVCVAELPASHQIDAFAHHEVTKGTKDTKLVAQKNLRDLRESS